MDRLEWTGSIGAEIIAQERLRQVAVKGYDASHDDGHTHAELAVAANAYVVCAALQLRRQNIAPPLFFKPEAWPWEPEDFRPSENPIINLVKAGALIAAEIDRLQRLEKKEAM